MSRSQSPVTGRHVSPMPLAVGRPVVSVGIGQFITVLMAGFVCAVACGISSCVTLSNCESAGTCTKADDALCSFTNVVSLSTVASYGSTTSTESLASMLRGVCAPGERLSGTEGTSTCVPFFPFPSALNTEIMDSSASSPHMRACGAWIDAGGASILRSTTEYRSMTDHSSWVTALEQAENATTYSPRTARGNMAKFRAECMRTVAGGSQAVHAAGKLAYQQLAIHIENTLTNRSGVLRSEAHLASRYCESSARVGSVLMSDSAFDLYVTDGYVFGTAVLSAALSVMGEATSVQNDADAAAAAISDASRLYAAQISLSNEDLTTFMHEAAGATDFTVPSTAIVSASILNAVLQHYETSPAQVLAYEKGLAAFCIYSLMQQFAADSVSHSSILQDTIADIKDTRAPAVNLGRLRTDDTEAEVDSEVVKNATTTTITQVVGITANSDEIDCLSAMRVFFADEVDVARFDRTIHPDLYSRLQKMVLSTRVGVIDVMTTSPINATLTEPALVAADVAVAGVKIVGAPRGSWAGLTNAMRNVGLNSKDGMFSMILKKTHASFQEAVIDSTIRGTVPACDHQPFYDATTPNAYMVASIKCAVIFLGILKRPWADSNYDDESLMSRAVGVIGHELAHLSLNTPYVTSAYDELLFSYTSQTRSEAIADVIAALAAVRTGYVTQDRFVLHWCQMWCARVPFAYMHPSSMIHPGPNERCDHLESTLARIAT